MLQARPSDLYDNTPSPPPSGTDPCSADFGSELEFCSGYWHTFGGDFVLFVSQEVQDVRPPFRGIFSTRSFEFSPLFPGFLHNLAREAPQNVEKIARFPGREKGVKFCHVLALMVFSPDKEAKPPKSPSKFTRKIVRKVPFGFLPRPLLDKPSRHRMLSFLCSEALCFAQIF